MPDLADLIERMKAITAIDPSAIDRQAAHREADVLLVEALRRHGEIDMVALYLRLQELCGGFGHAKPHSPSS